jgi:hypothetical protein
MTTNPHAIVLAAAEQILLDQIELDALALRDHVHTKQNGELVCKLMRSLVAREAIPAQRMSWFTNADYHIGGRGSSRRDVFERNGRTGAEILEHPHFLKYVRYFVYGPDLPGSVVEAFAERIAECGHVTSSDILPIAKFARQQARTQRLDPRAASEEFFKLALEHGWGSDCAVFVRDQVRTLR